MDLRQTSLHRLQLDLTSAVADSSIFEPIAAQALQASNGNASGNTYLWQDPAMTMQAARVASQQSQPSVLSGIPVSVKDCFDLAGSPTSCGTHFYRDRNGIATQDSWIVETLRKNGAVLTGKTHLHPLAYGITGQNPDYGDCLQPGDPTALTGGSSSGAAASILEGSALAAIGTDTGGSIRVPAALCGIAGYRASIGRGSFRGGAHLAPSFDTLGWLFRDLQDGPKLGSVLQPNHPGNKAENLERTSKPPSTFAVPDKAFLEDCEPPVLESLIAVIAELESLGMTRTQVSVNWWHDSLEIFAPIQASEAAKIHAGNFASIAPEIRQRLEWGAALSQGELAALRQRHAQFRQRMDSLLVEHEFLLLPAAPVVRLAAGADHSQTRARLLRYTTPVSLSGMPAVTIPILRDDKPAGGMQLVAAREDDRRLLQLAARIGSHRKSAT